MNKIDLVDFSEPRFREIETAFAQFAAPLGLRSIVPIPLSARRGDNVATASRHTGWYEGPTLLDHLETVVHQYRHTIARLKTGVPQHIR